MCKKQNLLSEGLAAYCGELYKQLGKAQEQLAELGNAYSLAKTTWYELEYKLGASTAATQAMSAQITTLNDEVRYWRNASVNKASLVSALHDHCRTLESELRDTKAALRKSDEHYAAVYSAYSKAPQAINSLEQTIDGVAERADSWCGKYYRESKLRRKLEVKAHALSQEVSQGKFVGFMIGMGMFAVAELVMRVFP